MTQLVQHLSTLGDRIHAVDAQDLRSTFLIKNRRDGRIETCLNLLETAGCTRGELTHSFEWVRTPDPDEIREWLPDDKRVRDLGGLLEMVRYANTDSCRKRHIHGYFGFDAMEQGCGSCDAAPALEPWLERTLPAERRRPVARPGIGHRSGDDEELQRGDWIEVRGLGLCHITRVHRGPRTRVDVELARDLSERSIELRKNRWRRVPRD